MIAALARAAGRSVSRETAAILNDYSQRVIRANERQNLVSAGSLDAMWKRHILDSAQLVRFESQPGASWVDIGSGAGLPGIVISLLVAGRVTLVEPRQLRAEFLAETVHALGLSIRVDVQATKVDRVQSKFDMITARAVAPLCRLLGIAHHLAHPETVWALPKGKNADSELAEARRSWHCEARSEISCTDADAKILVLSEVRARARR
jgi:16S rRNA (guanine527-N7)-methyltransferase